ncbi:MAG: YjbH domain-containing protein [Armatimonadetes bacterium]|nr:YjbH domain-containing protein [Armatimonadota bacterium]
MLVVLCNAKSSYSSPTGSILYPTAEVMERKEIRFELSLAANNGSLRSLGEKCAFLQLGFGAAEAGIDYYSVKDERSCFAFNIKFRLLKEGKENPQVAIGIMDWGSNLSATKYIALSKSFGRLSIHIGHCYSNGNWNSWTAVKHYLAEQTYIAVERFFGTSSGGAFGMYVSVDEQIELGAAIIVSGKRQFRLSVAWTFR